MLPIILSPNIRVGLCGCGAAGARRAAQLRDAGISAEAISDEPGRNALDGLHVLFIAGLKAPHRLAELARATGVLVNVEDMPELCDFHVPASVRRGDLLLTVSTAGRVPGLARLVREWLDAQFSADWSDRLEILAQARQRWRNEGTEPAAIVPRLRRFMDEKGWLK